MRKITRQIMKAWITGREKKIGNTSTDGESVWLHGNKIIEIRGDDVWGTLAGWNTPTTKERLNGITGGRFRTIRFQPCFYGEPINDTDWIKIGPLTQCRKHYLENRWDAASEWRHYV